MDMKLRRVWTSGELLVLKLVLLRSSLCRKLSLSCLSWESELLFPGQEGSPDPAGFVASFIDSLLFESLESWVQSSPVPLVPLRGSRRVPRSYFLLGVGLHGPDPSVFKPRSPVAHLNWISENQGEILFTLMNTVSSPKRTSASKSQTRFRFIIPIHLLY